jgi:hypothetical protein
MTFRWLSRFVILNQIINAFHVQIDNHDYILIQTTDEKNRSSILHLLDIDSKMIETLPFEIPLLSGQIFVVPHVIMIS